MNLGGEEKIRFIRKMNVITQKDLTLYLSCNESIG